MYLKMLHPQPGFTVEGEDTINRIEFHTADSWFTGAYNARFHPFKSMVRLGQVSMYLKKSHPQTGFTGEGEDTINRIYRVSH